MPKDSNEIFSEVSSIIFEVEGQFIARDYQSPFTAYVDYKTWRGIHQYVQSNRIGSVVNDSGRTYIQYQNWKIVGQAELKDEIIMFPSDGVRRQLNRT
jgi:hypothetical protein